MRDGSEGMTDHQVAVWGMVLTALGAIGTWLALPQLQRWWHQRQNDEASITLGPLSNPRPQIRTGTANADRKTLHEMLAFLPSRMQWLSEHNFGDGFWLSHIRDIEDFVRSHGGPEHEFLNEELEGLRIALWENFGKFSELVGIYTFNTSSSTEPGSWMRIMPRDEYDEEGNHSNREFFRKAREINEASEDVWNQYQELVRRARLLLASDEGVGGES